MTNLSFIYSIAVAFKKNYEKTVSILAFVILSHFNFINWGLILCRTKKQN